MRNVIRYCTLLFALALVLPLTLSAQSATITADRVNVRATAAIDGSIVGQLSRGATVTVLEKNDTWTKVQSGSMTGWVRSNLLAASTASAAPAKSDSKASEPKASPSKSGGSSSSSRPSSGQAATAGTLFDGTNKFIGVHVGASAYGSTASFGANAEMPYNDRIGIGAWVDYWSYGYDFAGGEGDYTYIALAGTGAYHFPIESNPKLDPYVGVGVGYFIVSWDCNISGFDCDSYDASASRIFIGGFGGLRYGFSDKIAANVRAGFGSAYLTLGIDFKM